MKQNIISILIIFIFSLLLFNCSEVQDEITTPAELEGVHSSSNLDSSSLEFHGRLSDGNGFESCKKCHDANLSGGLTEVSCVECHTTINVHKEGIFTPSSPNFHGKYFADNNLEMSSCKECHGNEYNGGIASPSCTECHDAISVHKEGIFEPSSPNFHGQYFVNNNLEMSSCKGCHGIEYSGGQSSPGCDDCHSNIDVHQIGLVSPESPNFHGKYLADNNLEMSSCMECHGDEYKGGISSPSCVDCHSAINVHKDGILDINSSNFHGVYLKNTNWALEECSQCHGSDYSGGFVSTTCNNCHTGSSGPESCNTCHGDFSNEEFIAPPKDLNDNTETTARGVGAHYSHLYGNDLGAPINCTDCHPKVESADNYVFAHINGLPAEMSLEGYNSNDLTCSNNYCHGGFEFPKSEAEEGFEYIHTGDAIVGENFSPKWTQVDGTQAACGTCHLLPPRGHLLEGTDPEAQLCGSTNCHPSAFNEDGTLNKDAHMNGEKDLN